MDRPRRPTAEERRKFAEGVRRIAGTRKARRGASPARGFRTREGGQNLARHAWICQACRTLYRQGEEVLRRPRECFLGCQGAEFWHADSVGEARYFLELLRDQDLGLVAEVEFHPPFPIHVVGPDGVPVHVRTWRADAAFTRLPSGERVVADHKPADPRALTREFLLLRALVEAQYGFTIHLAAR